MYFMGYKENLSFYLTYIFIRNKIKIVYYFSYKILETTFFIIFLKRCINLK